MKKHAILLDAAHGEEVPGKRSPDGSFREYLWSRMIIRDLIIKLKAEGYKVYETNPSTKEIGLTQRANVANNIAEPKKIFISLHANAAGSGAEWLKARGYSVYTTKGKTNSDTVAELMMKQFKVDFPELKARPDMSDGDLDQEENFTVISKTNCPAVLVEWNFQDNREDVAILLSAEYNKRFINSLVEAINKIDETLT